MSKTAPKPTLNQQIAELDQAIEWFYGEDFNLDEALAKYQAANDLADRIASDLRQLKNKVTVIADFTKD